MLSRLLLKDKLTLLFCLLDDFLALLPKPNQALVSGRNPAGRPANLTPSEVLTLALFRFWTTLGNWKAFYAMIDAGFRQEFPQLPCYETLLRQINAHGPLGLLLLIALLGRHEGPGTYALDATAIPALTTDAKPRWCGNGPPGARTATATGSLASSFIRSATCEVNWSACGSLQATPPMSPKLRPCSVRCGAGSG
jgi:hypothetical protein